MASYRIKRSKGDSPVSVKEVLFSDIFGRVRPKVKCAEIEIEVWAGATCCVPFFTQSYSVRNNWRSVRKEIASRFGKAVAMKISVGGPPLCIKITIIQEAKNNVGKET